MERIIIAKDGTSFLVREPKISDVNSFMEMFNKVVNEPGIGLNRSKKVTLKEEKEWLKSSIVKIKKNEEIMLLIEKDGKIVGNSTLERRSMCTKEAHTATFGITLAKEVRNKGLGQRIIPILIKLARKRMKGLEIIELEVFSRNKPAYHVYEKMGFRKVAVIPNKAKEKRNYVDSIVMQKYLKKI